MVMIEVQGWGLRGVPSTPTETIIRNTLCKFVIEFSFIRTFTSNYFSIKILRIYLCKSNFLLLTLLKPSFISFHEYCFLQMDIGQESIILIVIAMLYLNLTTERLLLKQTKNKLFIFV